MVMFLQRNDSCIFPKYIRIDNLIPENTEGFGGEKPPSEATTQYQVLIIVNYAHFSYYSSLIIMSSTSKSSTWKLVLQLIVAALSAIATTLGVTSCMGVNQYV